MQTKLTVATVETRTDKSGNEYGYITGTQHAKKGDKPVVAMAFGKSFQSTRPYLKAGKTAVVTAEFDGGTLKILGRRAGTRGTPLPAAA